MNGKRLIEEVSKTGEFEIERRATVERFGQGGR
jgi:hypothetical protein